VRPWRSVAFVSQRDVPGGARVYYAMGRDGCFRGRGRSASALGNPSESDHIPGDGFGAMCSPNFRGAHLLYKAFR